MGCHPDDLWTKYFTSSKVVQEYREKYGEPDVVEVRRTFLSQTDARSWEHKVLRRLKVIGSKRWLNKSNGQPPLCYLKPGEIRVVSNETRKKISQTKLERGWTQKQIDANVKKLGVRLPEETKQKMSEAHKGRPKTKEHQEKITASLNKPETIKRRKELFRGENNPFFGKSHSEESRDKMRQKATGRIQSDETRKKRSESVRLSWERRRNVHRTHSNRDAAD